MFCNDLASHFATDYTDLFQIFTKITAKGGYQSVKIRVICGKKRKYLAE